jgi:predicted type IV restriction endonuclease/GTPase SAR1 family protein
MSLEVGMDCWDIDTAYENFIALVNVGYDTLNLNESDTRAKLITKILTCCLGWDERDITREEYVIDSGEYLDYKLSLNLPVLIVEAKRSSDLFDIPSTSSIRELKIGGVISKSKSLMLAIAQARNYAMQKGVQYCCVSNGVQYAIFKVHNSSGRDWSEHKVAIFRSLEDISNNFSIFCDYLSKASYENGIIHKQLRFERDDSLKLREFKTLETLHLSHPRKKNRNSLFYQLEEVVRKVFQDLASEDAEKEILEHCYVDSPRKRDKGLPYLDFDAERLQVDKKSAGDFQKRVVALLTAQDNSRSEVIFLLGSVGVGKSTFIQRFRKVLADDYIDELGIWIYLDFRGFSDTGDVLDEFVYQELLSTLENDYSQLGLDDWAFIKSSYHAEYNKLKKGILKPIYEESHSRFEEKFSDYISSIIEKDPHRHIEKILRHSSSKLNRKIFLVFDNADQLAPRAQNEIFLLAQKMSERLKCNTLISMREESYWKNRDSGPLNAFHTVAYHVQAPKLEQVLAKRFHYAKALIDNGDIGIRFNGDISNLELNLVVDRIQQSLLGDDSSYIDFIAAVAPRDNRRALDDVAAFIVSGHTNLDAIVRDIRKNNPSGLVVPFHEFLDSVILRDHETFFEDKSSVLNLYGVSGDVDASSSNRLAVLGRILSFKNVSSDVGTGYILIDELISDLQSVGILQDTTHEILALFNSRRLIESETTIKETLEGSCYVRATSAGEYYIGKLGISFGYLDIIVSSTPIGDNEVFAAMSKIKQEINELSTVKVVDRLRRVKLRVQLVRKFIDYLVYEIKSSKFMSRQDLYSQDLLDFPNRLEAHFAEESKAVIENATKIFQGADS